MSFESDEKRLKKGSEILKKLNFLHKAEGSFSTDFRSHTVENLFGTVWTRPGLEIQERSMITLAGLIALNRENELRLHFRGARNLGLSKEKNRRNNFSFSSLRGLAKCCYFWKSFRGSLERNGR